MCIQGMYLSIYLYCVMCSGKQKLKFRSYNPQTEELKEKKLPKAKPEEGAYIYIHVHRTCFLALSRSTSQHNIELRERGDEG